MKSDRIASWTFLAFAFVIATLALIFAVLAYCDAAASQPHKNLQRQDLHLAGNLTVDGEMNCEGSVAMDDTLTVQGVTQLQKLFVTSPQYINLQSFSSAGSFVLGTQYSVYRVDAASGTVNLTLPPAASAPGMVYWISKSQLGQSSTLNLLVTGGSGDTLCSSSGCAATVPAFVFPTARPAIYQLTNDGVGVWQIS